MCLEEGAVVAVCVSVCRSEGGGCGCVCVCSSVEIVHQMSGFLFWSVDFLFSMKGNGNNWSYIHQHIKKKWLAICFLQGYLNIWWHSKQKRSPTNSAAITKTWWAHPGDWYIPSFAKYDFSFSLLFFSPLRIHDVPSGSAVWVWLNNYKLQAADLSFTFLNMPTCAFCGDANQYQSFSHYCHWKYSGSMFVLFPGFWRYNVAQQFAVNANNTKELHNKSFLYLLSPPLCHWN